MSTETDPQHDATMKWMGYAIVASVLLAILNHQLAPSYYSLTHLFFSYDEGFVRRGLVGEVLTWVWPEHPSQRVVFTTAFLITFSGMVSFLVLMLRFLPRSPAGNWVLLIALNSYGLSSYLGASGYLDGILLTLTALAILAPRGWVGVAVKSVLIAIGALVHEIMVPYFAVLIALDLWLSGRGAERWRAVVPLGFGIAFAAMLFAIGEPSAEALESLYAQIADRAPFEPYPDALAVLGQSIDSNSAAYDHFRETSPVYYFMVYFDGSLGLAMAAWLFWLCLATWGPSDIWTKLAIWGAIFAAFSMNLVAVDVVRFSSMAILCGFMAVAMVCRHGDGTAERLSARLTWPVALLVLVLNANLFTMGLGQDAGHEAQMPWVILHQLNWLRPIENLVF